MADGVRSPARPGADRRPAGDGAIWLATLRVAAGLGRQTSSYSPLGHGGEDISDDQAERRALFNKVVEPPGRRTAGAGRDGG